MKPKKTSFKNSFDIHTLFIICIIILSFFLSLTLILKYEKTGLPTFFHPDEPIITNKVASLIEKKSWDIGYYKYPSFTFYFGKIFMMLIPAKITHVFGFTYVLRLGFSIVAQLSLIFLYFSIKKLTSSRLIGMTTLIISLFSFYNMRIFWYIGPDVLVFALSNTLVYISFLMFQSNDNKQILYKYLPIFCFVLGVAISTKYNAAAMGIILIYIFIQKKMYKSYKNVIFFALNLCLILVVFIVLNLSIFNDVNLFIEHFLWNFNHYENGHPSLDHIYPKMFYLKSFLFTGYGWVGGIFVILGIIFLIKEKKYSLLGFLLIFPVTLILIQGKYPVVLDRNNASIMPYFYIFIGLFFANATFSINNKFIIKFIKYACYLYFAILICLNIFVISNLFKYKDSRLIGNEWIQENLPHGATIYVPNGYTTNPIDDDLFEILPLSHYTLPEDVDKNTYVVFVSFNDYRFLKKKPNLFSGFSDEYYYPDNAKALTTLQSDLIHVKSIRGKITNLEYISLENRNEFSYYNLLSSILDDDKEGSVHIVDIYKVK